jgi:hypothetical protein
MNDYMDIEQLLRAEAETVQVSLQMPKRVTRRIRARRATVLTLAALSIAAAASLVVISPWRTEILEPAESRPRNGALARGKVNGTPWRMELHTKRTKAGKNSEIVCIVTRGEEQCWQAVGKRSSRLVPVGRRYGDAGVIVGYIRPLDRSIVLVRTPTEDAGVTMREVSGTAWAALWAPTGDNPSDPSYWYRLFPGSVEGILQITGVGAPQLAFEVKVLGKTVHASVQVTEEEFPELAGYPGEKELVGSGPDGGGYSIFKRTTDSVVCLHLNDISRCRPATAPVEPIRLAIGKPFRCAPEDGCRGSQRLVIVAGEVSPEVTRIGIDDGFGTSFVQVGGPSDERHFSTMIYGERTGSFEVIAFDENDEELQRITLEY